MMINFLNLEFSWIGIFNNHFLFIAEIRAKNQFKNTSAKLKLSFFLSSRRLCSANGRLNATTGVIVGRAGRFRAKFLGGDSEGEVSGHFFTT